MSGSDATARDSRVLVLVPTSKDASVTRTLLSSNGISLEVCTTFEAMVQDLRLGAAAILLPEEAVSPAHNTGTSQNSRGTTAMVRPSRASPDSSRS